MTILIIFPATPIGFVSLPSSGTEFPNGPQNGLRIYLLTKSQGLRVRKTDTDDDCSIPCDHALVYRQHGLGYNIAAL